MLRLALTTLATACAVTAILAAKPPAAPAARTMISVMQDDNQLVYGTVDQRRNALNRMRGLGVDAVRITLLWKAIAPGGQSRRKPRGFDGADPAAYPAQLWDPFDSLVLEAQARGIAVHFNPTGPGPLWAHKRTRVRAARSTYKPSPKEFRKFVKAAGRRYDGTYPDTNGQPLPRVSWWGIWNEPNQPGWLTPQGERKRGVGMVAAAPHLYRTLLVQGARALRATGHGKELLLIGALAPIGSAKKPKGVIPSLRPGLFLREMFCLNNRYRRFKGQAAKARNCENLKNLRVLKRFRRLGFGHHPYTRKRSPRKRERKKDMLNIGNVGALPRALDKIARRTRLIPRRMPVYFMEFGYQTLPPDPFRGVSLAAQAEYINDGEYIAWRHPRIRSTAQFQLYDVPPRTEFPRDTAAYWATYQSGLFTALPEGAAKPAANAYKFPLVVRRKRGKARIWGQVKFAANGSTYPVIVQRRARGSSTWVTMGPPIQVTNSKGYFRARRPHQRGSTWRAVWATPDFTHVEISREAVAR